MRMDINKYTYFDYAISFSVIEDSTNRLNPFESPRQHLYLRSQKFGEVTYPKYNALMNVTLNRGLTY